MVGSGWAGPMKGGCPVCCGTYKGTEVRRCGGGSAPRGYASNCVNLWVNGICVI